MIRENAEGRIYGITFVDHRTKCVFNGSDLGKPYSANGIVNRLSEKEQVSKQFRPGYSEVKKPANQGLRDKANPEKADLGLKSMVDDLTKAESNEYLSPEAAMKLRRKKKRRKGHPYEKATPQYAHRRKPTCTTKNHRLYQAVEHFRSHASCLLFLLQDF